MIFFDYEKMCFFAEALKDPYGSEVISYTVEVFLTLFFILIIGFLIGFIFGNVYSLFDWLIEKMIDYRDRKKGDSDE